jgi:hypothetical protein
MNATLSQKYLVVPDIHGTYFLAAVAINRWARNT